jgi:hypothetical protein
MALGGMDVERKVMGWKEREVVCEQKKNIFASFIDEGLKML